MDTKQKQLIVILVIVALIIGMVLVSIWIKQKPISPKERFEKRSQEFKKLYEEKLSQGYNLTESENLAKKAKQSYEKGDYESAIKLLEEAIIALKMAKKISVPPTPTPTPLLIPIKWSSDDYMNYYTEYYINKQLPQLTKEQINSIINNKSEKLTKKIKDIQDFYTKERNKVSTSELTTDEKKKAFGIIDEILNSIAQLKEDIDKRQNIDIIYSDYNKLRSSVIQEYHIQHEIRTKYAEPKYDEFIQKYMPEEYHSMKFGVLTEYASLYSPKIISEGDILKEIDILSETGVDMIMIYVVYDFWMDQDEETINKIDKAVERIRENNKKVYIGLYGVNKWFGPYKSHLENVGHGKVDFETWKKTYLEMTETIVKRYNPDYVAISIEAPVVLAAQVNEIISASDWIEITRQIADKVKEISSDTIVVVPIIVSQEPSDIEFLKGIMNIKNVDIVGADVYGLPAVQSIDTLLPYWNKEKEFWITEAWNDLVGKYIDSLDDKFIIASVYYAQSNNITGYNIFFGQNMHTKDFEKTPAFYTYNQVIDEVRNNEKS